MFRSTIISLAVALCLSGAVAAGRAPNIVLILADDLGVNPVSAYGSTYYQTPVIDQLARDGIRFTAAYAAAPVCSPTRGALLTGKYPARTHLTDFISGNPFPAAKLRQPKWKRVLPLAEVTIAEALADRGYATALFGKWHLARGYLPPQSLKEGPDRQGFAETFITHKPTDKSDPEQDAHQVGAVTERALDFIDRHRNEPFFLLLTHNTIHSPIMAPRALVEKYQDRPGASDEGNNPTIAAMMEIFDDAIGAVLARLDQHQLSERTIVIFYSDNGGLLRDTSQSPLRGGKAQLHEGGLRVPLIIRWPGVITPQRTSDFPLTSVDFFPTLLSLAGVGTETARPEIDGIDFAPLLRQQPLPPRPAIYWHYPHYHLSGFGGPAGAMRAGDWKLIEYFETTLTGTGAPLELFDLRSDPGEKENLAARYPERVAAMQADLARWRESVGAQMPTINPDYDSAFADRANGAISQQNPLF